MMDELKCAKCGSRLQVIRGGPKYSEEKKQIVHIHIFGCSNSDCELKETEQNRTGTPIESFNE